MDQLLLRRLKLLDAAAQMIKERLKIENMVEVTLQSLGKVKVSKEKINKKINEILLAKQINNLIETEFMPCKEQAVKI